MKNWVLLSLLLSFSCMTNERKTEKEAEAHDDSTAVEDEDAYSAHYTDLDFYLTEKSAAGADIQTIDSTCALIVMPNKNQMDEMTKEYGDDLESVADDGFYYQGLAINILDSLQVKRIEANENSLIEFVGNRKTYLLDVRRKGLPEWNIVFFNKNKDPEIISAIDLTPERTKQYFSPNPW